MLPRLLRYSMAFWLLSFSAADAGLVISVGSKDLAAGSSGNVPVYISSSPGTGPINVAMDQFEFQITGTENILTFTASPVPDPTFADPNYIFSDANLNNTGQSFDASQSIGLSTNLGADNYPYDQFYGGDSAVDNNFNLVNAAVPDMLPTLADNMLLALLPVTAFTAVPGDTFTISLVPTGGSNDPTTSFVDSAGSYDSYSSTPGTVTITAAAAATPEPGTLGMFLLGATGLLWRSRQRRVRQARTQA